MEAAGDEPFFLSVVRGGEQCDDDTLCREGLSRWIEFMVGSSLIVRGVCIFKLQLCCVCHVSSSFVFKKYKEKMETWNL